jgi:hypothetical protein
MLANDCKTPTTLVTLQYMAKVTDLFYSPAESDGKIGGGICLILQLLSNIQNQVRQKNSTTLPMHALHA